MAVGFSYVWHERPVPAGLEIRQVYGYLLCPRTARVLIQDVGEGKFNLLLESAPVPSARDHP